MRGFIRENTEELRAGHFCVLQLHECICIKCSGKKYKTKKNIQNKNKKPKPGKKIALQYTYHGINNYTGQASTSLNKSMLFSTCEKRKESITITTPPWKNIRFHEDSFVLLYVVVL